jgi:hypothetical protein
MERRKILAMESESIPHPVSHTAHRASTRKLFEPVFTGTITVFAAVTSGNLVCGFLREREVRRNHLGPSFCQCQCYRLTDPLGGACYQGQPPFVCSRRGFHCSSINDAAFAFELAGPEERIQGGADAPNEFRCAPFRGEHSGQEKQVARLYRLYVDAIRLLAGRELSRVTICPRARRRPRARFRR